MLKVKVSNGNHKIGKDTLIINMNSATDCPSYKLGLCQVERKQCYALKAERQYPSCLPYRKEQTIIWENNSAVDIANAIIKIAKNKRKNIIKYVRFNEAGDFKGQADIVKMSKIADILKDIAIKGNIIKVYGYTARKDLNFSNISDNMVVNGSNFMIHNNFVVVKQPISKIICKGNCRICNLCKVRTGKIIEVKLH